MGDRDGWLGRVGAHTDFWPGLPGREEPERFPATSMRWPAPQLGTAPCLPGPLVRHPAATKLEDHPSGCLPAE